MSPSLRWPIHPPPRHGESLSSWLYRIAAAHYLTLGELLEHDLGQPPGAAEMLDCAPPPELVTAVSRRSGIAPNRVRGMSVSGHVPWLLDSLDPQGNDLDVYVRQLSVLLRTSRRGSGGRRRPGSGWRPWLSAGPLMRRACPRCADDPHSQGLTLASGLPLQLSCPTHRCFLEPCFGYPDQLHWDTERPLPRPAPPAVVTLDRYTDQALDNGAVSLPGRVVHGGMWFRLLRTLVDELCSPLDDAGTVVREIWASRGGRSPRLLYRPFESLRWPDQAELLTVAADTITCLDAGEITPQGDHGHLFIPEPVGPDLPPGRHRRRQRPTRPAYPKPLQAASDGDHYSTAAAAFSRAITEAVDAARRDPHIARTLFGFTRQSCHTEQELERLLGTFDALDIPTHDLRGDLGTRAPHGARTSR